MISVLKTIVMFVCCSLVHIVFFSPQLIACLMLYKDWHFMNCYQTPRTRGSV